MDKIEALVEKLRDKDDNAAYDALQRLLAESRASARVLPFLPDFFSLLAAPSAYLRTRGLLLVCANARWDAAGLIEEKLPLLLAHITDEKPAVARQFVRALPELAQAKPQCVPAIRQALLAADLSAYRESMRPLIEKDIQAALTALG